MLVAVLVIKFVCVDVQFSKPFKSYLGQDIAYKFIINEVKESKYCCRVMKKHFNKELAMTKEDNESFESSKKWWICDNAFVEFDVKVTDRCTSLENTEALHTEIVISRLN